MALLERVSTLIRANLNDLVDKAEDPEKMIKQVILDMENQLLQVKTQVAISIADQHVLEKKLKENEDADQQWMRRADMALDKHDDVLARNALERAMTYRATAESFRQPYLLMLLFGFYLVPWVMRNRHLKILSSMVYWNLRFIPNRQNIAG